MKKLAIAAAVSTAVGMSSSVMAYDDQGLFSPGLVVPVAQFDTATGAVTAVGLTTTSATHQTTSEPGCSLQHNGAGTDSSLTVFWTFFDVDSNHIKDGTFTMTANDRYNFIWNASTAGSNVPGDPGYLVFVINDDATFDIPLTAGQRECLNGAAFYVEPAADDVIVVPTLNLDEEDIVNGSNLTNLGPTSIINASPNAADDGEYIYMRYLIDHATGGDDTTLVLWTTDDPEADDTATVDIYDDDQNRESGNLPLPNDELNIVDVEADVVGIPASYTDGFILYTVAAASGSQGGAFSYSVIKSSGFSAKQTILNAITGND